MGYATVMRVPRISNYAEALKRYDNTKPIKGRSDDPRPLGERRDVDTYSIRKNVWTNAVELVLYKTPVITFTTDDEVKIKFGTWSSASTCQFITRVLMGVGAYRVKGQVVLGFTGSEARAMIADHEELALVRTSNGGWTPKVKQTLYDYRVNRKEANNVRKQVSQFKDYMAGVIKLKAEEVQGVYGRDGFTVVRTTYGELIEVFGKEESDHGIIAGNRVRPNVDGWDRLSDKPKHYRPEHRAEAWANYHEKTEKFFDLVRNDQDDDARHQNYWIAFNVLMIQGQGMHYRDTDAIVTLGTASFNNFLEQILFKMFSDKVYTKVALPEGKVPTGKYDEYVKTEED